LKNNSELEFNTKTQDLGQSHEKILAEEQGMPNRWIQI
jgi:hypothetical protein